MRKIITSRPSLLFWGVFTLLCSILVRLDRDSFKQNDEFNIRHILPNVSFNAKWEIAPPTQDQMKKLDAILSQPFYYLARGQHSFAFLSQDGSHVIKFHKFPTHMRTFSWVNRPFANAFSKKRQKVKEYNINRLDHCMNSYKNSFIDLKEETGVIYVHTNRTRFLNRSVCIVDKMGNTYRVPLDEATFILQRKADLIYTTLDRLKASKDVEGGKKVVSAVIQLFVSCCEKGYVDEDPILRKNYGIIGDKAIHIDIGEMVKREEVKQKKNAIAHVKEMTESLRKRLVRDYPYLLEHYNQEIERLD